MDGNSPWQTTWHPQGAFFQRGLDGSINGTTKEGQSAFAGALGAGMQAMGRNMMNRGQPGQNNPAVGLANGLSAGFQARQRDDNNTAWKSVLDRMQQTQQGSQHHLGPIPTQQAVAPSVHPQGPGAFQPAVGGKNTTSNASTTPIPEWTTNNAASQHPLGPITTPQAVAPSAHPQAPAGAFQPTPPTSLPMPQSPYGRSPYVLDPSQRSPFASD